MLGLRVRVRDDTTASPLPGKLCRVSVSVSVSVRVKVRVKG